jgi:amino acid adenylation domain-containing protein
MTAGTIHGLLLAAAEAHGQRLAVVDGERQCTYSELEARSGELARALVAEGVGPGDRVALMLEKSLESIIAVYAILRAGGTYVPLDDQAPVARLAYILRDAGIRVLISDRAQAPRWEALLAAGAPLATVIAAGIEDVDAPGLAVIAWSRLHEAPAGELPRATDPDGLAYILYTSGSTGEPKGVMLSHRNGRAFVDWAAAEVGVTPADRLSSHAPLHFDLSTFDLYAAARAGAAVVLVPRASSVFPVTLANWIAEQRISIWYSVPSILTLLVLRGQLESGPLSRLRTIIFAGEVFPTKHLQQLMRLVPQARYLNFFGPTETNVCTWYEVAHGREVEEPLPIGHPLPGVQASIAGEDGAPVATGEVGELWIGGPTVMHGYWGDPSRTQRALRGQGAVRIYRTGDMVRARDGDGALLFLGRRDAQIKTRGYRVELGEIEAVLNAVDAVIECAVIAVPDDVITNRLVAIVSSDGSLTAADLSSEMRNRLPAYMIPEFEFMRTLPKSSTGKVDRRQLLMGALATRKG